MIKVLGVVVIAAGLWWYLSKDKAPDVDPWYTKSSLSLNKKAPRSFDRGALRILESCRHLRLFFGPLLERIRRNPASYVVQNPFPVFRGQIQKSRLPTYGCQIHDPSHLRSQHI